jgi:hypothetical protein
MESFKHYIIPVLLIAFLIFRTIRRTIGLQKYSKTRLSIRIVIFSIVSLLMVGLAIAHPISLIYDTVGILIGLGLLYLSIKNIVFEKRNDELFYRTHIWIELSVLSIFFARLSYRFYILFKVFENVQSPDQIRNQLADIRDPLTASIFFIICTYYIGYFGYVLKIAKQPL